MKQQFIIRKIGATVLLLLLVIGCVHKQLLHNLFANHTDCKIKITSSSSTGYVTQLQMNCQCNDMVVESPFTPTAFSQVHDSSIILPVNTVPDKSFIITDSIVGYSLRGPPSRRA